MILSLDIEVGSCAVSVKMEVCGVIDSFIFFLTKYDEKVTHNMLSLMLNTIHKSLKSKFSFIGQDHSNDILSIRFKHTRIIQFFGLFKKYLKILENT
jgi:hypothetical protein